MSELLENVLGDLKSMGGIQASALVSNEGHIMVSDIDNVNVDSETFGAIVAMLIRSAAHTADQLNKGDIEYLFLKTKNGRIIMTKVNSKVTLTVLTNADENVGLTVEKMKEASEKIKAIFIRI